MGTTTTTQSTTTETPETTTTTIATTTTTEATTTSFKGCEYDGTKYEVGDTWTPKSSNKTSCMECSCTNEEGNIHCDNLHERCNLTCDGQLTYLEGQCCPICQKNVCNVKSELRPLATEKEGKKCISKEMVEMTSCQGTCGSTAHTIDIAPFIQTDCKCCKPVHMTKRSVQMDCDGADDVHEHIVITACSCEACQYNPFGPHLKTSAPTIVTPIA